MDKRWIFILIIFIIGCSCLYVIVDSSSILGSANTYVGKFTVSLPSEYNVEESGSDFVSLVNRNTNEKISIMDFGKNFNVDKFQGEITLEYLENENITSIQDTAFKYGKLSLPSTYYVMLPNNTVNQDIYLTEYNHTFVIEATNFKDNATMQHDIKSLIDSLKPDPKQKQD